MIVSDTYAFCVLWKVQFNPLTGRDRPIAELSEPYRKDSGCSLRAVSVSLLKVINLISAAGLAIEFTGHIIHNFRKVKGLKLQKSLNMDDRDQRVIETMKTMGPAVVLGVTMTNLPGIITLNWAHMQIIQELIL